MTTNTLCQVVNVEVLQEVQERFATATGLGVIIANEYGVPITNPSNFTSFCSKMRSSEEGLKCCVLSDEILGLKAAEQGKPVVHYCHAGLIDLAAPIILNEKYIGSVLCGQVLIENQDENQIKIAQEYFKKLPIDQELLQLYFEQIEFTSQKRIESTLHMLQLVADYIVEMASNYIIEKELNMKNEELCKKSQVHNELDSLLQEMQLKVLQSQINPHFLFNTLNTISRIAYLENAEQTQNVTYSLAKIMRYSLRNVSEPVTLKEELDYIQCYLSIQQFRFGDQIQYEQHLNLDLEAMRIPIFSIQPIIENAIIHGLEPKEGESIIRFTGIVRDDEIILEISDTGVGMPEEKISSIFSREENIRNSHTTGIGINNVQKRMKHYFGEEYGIKSITSEIGKGTTVKITLPFQEVYVLESNDC